VELEGQTAIVTGAGRGIGRAIALELARLGAGIVVAEVNQETAAKTAAEVEQLGRRAMGIRVDVTRAEDRQAMVDQTMRVFGRIDVLVNNAGIYRTAPRLDITEEHWDSVLAVNSKAVLFCSLAVLPHMLAARRGVIVNLASMAGKVPSTTALPYAVSKAAVISLTRSLAAAYARDGIRVNCVCPGTFRSAIHADLPPEALDAIAARHPLGLGAASDIVGAYSYLASDASRWTTGSAIVVDGGYAAP